MEAHRPRERDLLREAVVASLNNRGITATAYGDYVVAGGCRVQLDAFDRNFGETMRTLLEQVETPPSASRRPSESWPPEGSSAVRLPAPWHEYAGKDHITYRSG